MASTTGGRSGRLATLGATRIALVRAAIGREQRPGVEVLALVGVVLDGDEVEPSDVGELGQLERLVHPGRVGAREHPELQLVSVVRHVRLLRSHRMPATTHVARDRAASLSGYLVVWAICGVTALVAVVFLAAVHARESRAA